MEDGSARVVLEVANIAIDLFWKRAAEGNSNADFLKSANRIFQLEFHANTVVARPAIHRDRNFKGPDGL